MGKSLKSPAPKLGPSIILVEPQLGENIGTSARAMGNFGLDDLRLVAPRDGWPNEYARKAAAGADWILEKAGIFERLEDAVADLSCVFATTARPRDMVKSVVIPADAAAQARQISADGKKVGFMFGREKAGLTNDHIALSDAIVMAPVDPNFASLNLAQAVFLIGYEWYKEEAITIGDGKREIGAYDGPGLKMRGTRPAVKKELVGLFDHLESELDGAGFLYPPEKRPAMVRNIRNMLQRMQPTEQDIRTLRGIISSLVAGARGGRND